MICIRFLLTPVLLVAVGAAPLCAEREFDVPTPTPAAIPGLTQVVLPNSMCAALSDTHNILVVGHKILNGQHLTVYRLDASGGVAPGAATRVALPRSDALKSFENYPLSLAFHPTLPLLYVWQDIAGPDVGVPDQNPVFKEFDHLLVYAIKDGALQLVQAHARGPEFSYKQTLGSIAVNAGGNRIFMPNVRNPVPVSGYDASVGYFRLDAQGMPVKAAGATVARPVLVTPVMSYPIGCGFVCATQDTTIFGCHTGPATWDIENRRAPIAWFYFAGVATPVMITGHPKLPYIYGSTLGASYFYRMEHADGYLTMLPTRLSVGGAAFQASPVYLSKRNKLAVGGVNSIYLVSLDAEGAFTKVVEAAALSEPSAHAYAYSEKFDRLYVAVGEAK